LLSGDGFAVAERRLLAPDGYSLIGHAHLKANVLD
jgi:hypothetical protein